MVGKWTLTWVINKLCPYLTSSRIEQLPTSRGISFHFVQRLLAEFANQSHYSLAYAMSLLPTQLTNLFFEPRPRIQHTG